MPLIPKIDQMPMHTQTSTTQPGSTRRGRRWTVNLEKYPIDALDSPAGQAAVQTSRAKMASNGVCLLPRFLTPEATQAMVVEARGLVDKAFFCHNTHTAYLKAVDESFPVDHPRRRLLRTDVGSVAYDYIPPDSPLRALYEWDALTDFIAAVLAKPTLYRHADTLGALSINVFTQDGSHAWHFDESEFTVTMMLQTAEQGGAFEYVANIRSDTEPHYDDVAKVLDGERGDVRSLPFNPGDLFIFAGRHTLHRLSPVGGSRPRLVPVLCYAERPDIVNSDRVRELFWGRTA